MHLKIKPENQAVKASYENHSEYHEGDSGLDLFVHGEVVVPAKALGFKIDMMISCEAFTDITKQGGNVAYYLWPRSSMGAKTPLRLSNSMGLIDAGYRGNIIALVDNLSESDYKVMPGSRLVQIVSPHAKSITFELVNSLSETSRGAGGLGSTGN